MTNSIANDTVATFNFKNTLSNINVIKINKWSNYGQSDRHSIKIQKNRRENKCIGRQWVRSTETLYKKR